MGVSRGKPITPDLGKEGAQWKPESGGGTSQQGLESRSGLSQDGSVEEKHPLSPIFQSLATSSHCPNPTRSHCASLPEHRAWHRVVGVEREMANGIY